MNLAMFNWLMVYWRKQVFITFIDQIVIAFSIQE